MTPDEQIAADFGAGDHSVIPAPASILEGSDAPLPDSFDETQAYLHGEGSENQQRLSEVQAAQDKLSKWLSTFHGPEPETVDNLRQQVDAGKLAGHDYFAMTGRIYAGGTGDTAQRDARGNITGYTSRDGSGTALGGPSTTPGLDAFHKMNPGAESNPGFSFMPEPATPMPRSVAQAVKPPGAQPAALPPALDLFSDRKLDTPFGSAKVNFSGAVNRNPVLPASTTRQTFSNAA